MKTIIMAGGMGTRITSVANNIPKPMIRVFGKPILEYQIENLKQNKLTDITIVTGYLGHIIREYFQDGSRFAVNINYFNETTPLGTAGALYQISGLDDDFLLVCGDTIFDIDFKRFIAFHKNNKAWATLMAHPNGHPYDSSLLVTQITQTSIPGGLPYDNHNVIQWMNKEDERLWYKNRVNAGIEIISPILLKEAKKNLHKEKIDLDRDILKPLVPSGKIYAYDTPEYIKDMGTPDRYYQVEKDITQGIIKQRNLSNKQKAIFLDRDGTINKDVGFLIDINKMKLLPKVAEAIKKINSSGYLAIVVTNQPSIARGDLSFEQLYAIHNKLETLLGKEGAYLDAIYFCPHHPDKGFQGERLEFKHACKCRKPNPGMLLQAEQDLNIDISQSYMIGDSDKDLMAGANAGCKDSFLVSETEPLINVVERILISTK